MNYEPIQNYGLIGNMRSAALVSTNGCVDFFCFPNFDSPTVFVGLLDNEKGGCFRISREGEGVETRQLYVPGTNVLLTRFLSRDGNVELTDFMPVEGANPCHCLMRKVTALNGEARVRMRCAPRFDYARAKHQADQRGENEIIFTPEGVECPPLTLQASVKVEIDGVDAAADFVLRCGECAYFLFGHEPTARPGDQVVAFVEAHLHTTLAYWRRWSAKSQYHGRWREMVQRSALVLKLMSSTEYGSWIAAPTFGLPEAIGGSRNWDYRYTWLRDTSFGLYALMRLGYTGEGQQFGLWLRDRLKFDREAGPLQVMYKLDGGTELVEVALEHLSGYRESKPVRIGNGAYDQLQLDIYGEIFDAFYLVSKYGDGPSYEDWERMKQVLEWLSRHWQDADNGIWEFRGGRQQFLHSRLMCWVAFDRGVRLGKKRSLPGPFDWMEKCRDAIVHDIHENFWDGELKSFVQYKGAKEVDAATLLMPLMRFISPSDPRWVSTLEAIERDLSVDALVKRYRSGNEMDGFESREGSFTACSFWLVEALARSRQTEKAHLLFEKMLEFSNHLGLFSEELSSTGEHLGNYPQALTHLALISAATHLDRQVDHKSREPWG